MCFYISFPVVLVGFTGFLSSDDSISESSPFAWRDSVKQLKRNEDFSSICGDFPSICGVSV